jgi:hypothetical protein
MGALSRILRRKSGPSSPTANREAAMSDPRVGGSTNRRREWPPPGPKRSPGTATNGHRDETAPVEDARRQDTALSTTHQDDDIERARRLLADDVSLERAWYETILRRGIGGALASSVEALTFSLRAGATALARHEAQRRLAELNETQLREICIRVQKIVPKAWEATDVDFLVELWGAGRG